MNAVRDASASTRRAHHAFVSLGYDVVSKNTNETQDLRKPGRFGYTRRRLVGQEARIPPRPVQKHKRTQDWRAGPFRSSSTCGEPQFWGVSEAMSAIRVPRPVPKLGPLEFHHQISSLVTVFATGPRRVALLNGVVSENPNGVLEIRRDQPTRHWLCDRRSRADLSF